jgi:hypothetical protein
MRPDTSKIIPLTVRRIAAEMRGKGDLDGADTWLKIIVAIGEMQITRLQPAS